MPTSTRNSQSFRPTASRKVAHFFQLETNPFFSLGARASNQRVTHISAKIQTKANSRHAIQKTGVNSGSGHADHQAAPTSIPYLRSPERQKRSHLSPEGHARMVGAARNNTEQSQLAVLAQGQPAMGAAAKAHGAGSSEQLGRARLFLCLTCGGADGVTGIGWVYTWLNPGGVE